MPTIIYFSIFCEMFADFLVGPGASLGQLASFAQIQVGIGKRQSLMAGASSSLRWYLPPAKLDDNADRPQDFQIAVVAPDAQPQAPDQ